MRKIARIMCQLRSNRVGTISARIAGDRHARAVVLLTGTCLKIPNWSRDEFNAKSATVERVLRVARMELGPDLVERGLFDLQKQKPAAISHSGFFSRIPRTAIYVRFRRLPIRRAMNDSPVPSNNIDDGSGTALPSKAPLLNARASSSGSASGWRIEIVDALIP